eukprot:g15079.t1
MSTVTKKELIDNIADATGEKRVVVKKVVQSFLDSIVVELGKGNRLEFRDFGVFEIKQRRARMAQNPRTLQPVEVPPKRTVKFKVGRLMKQTLSEPAPDVDNPADLEPDTPAADATLGDLKQQQRLRELRVAEPSGKMIRVDGRDLLNLAGNDYLGLSQHPALIHAAISATRVYGIGSGASRLVSGNHPLHQRAEQRFAKFKHAEAALLLPTGYAANLAVLTTLAGANDLIVMDKLVHASLIDAARASEAGVRTYPHLNLDRAEQLLVKHKTGRRFLVTDSVFSMDGDCADLPALCELADRTNASLIVDEAHGTGVLGPDGSGLAAEQGVADRVYTCGTGGVVISTASKALGSLGGLVTAARPIIDLILNKARPFIYSTAVPPAQAVAVAAAVGVVRTEPERRKRLAELAVKTRDALRDAGCSAHPCETPTPFIPLIAGDEQAALTLQAKLLDAGIFAPAIRPPTVAPGQCRTLDRVFNLRDRPNRSIPAFTLDRVQYPDRAPRTIGSEHWASISRSDNSPAS